MELSGKDLLLSKCLVFCEFPASPCMGIVGIISIQCSCQYTCGYMDTKHVAQVLEIYEETMV